MQSLRGASTRTTTLKPANFSGVNASVITFTATCMCIFMNRYRFRYSVVECEGRDGVPLNWPKRITQKNGK